ncbi:hypothetical protein ACFQ09_17265 [Massilia norwichensis]|uniref:NHL repeat-containing protein n=1 Tax=Massilia norwichensis TaxID=1442366 RepID=A0ABT2ADB6_9BURK|nr:hypothetical protein [Massilia norwichensis]MCS0592205.1 hypothetical protein [Massilia norwichensis]
MDAKIARSFATSLLAALCTACGGGGGDSGTTGAGAPALGANVTTLTLVAGSALDTGNVDAGGSAARFGRPVGIAADTAGNLFVADQGNCSIRKISAAGAVSTLAGSPQRCQSVDGAAGAAGFASLNAIAASPDGRLYAADGLAVREIDPAGTVRTIATLDTATILGAGDIPYFYASGIAVDGFANVVVANAIGIRKISPTGTISMIDGMARLDNIASVVGSRNFQQRGLAAAKDGTVYVGDFASTVSRIDPAGTRMALAGLSGGPGFADGVAGAARFDRVIALTLDAAGNLYAADAGNNLIRKITPERAVSTVAGTIGATSLQLGNGPGALPALAGLTGDGKNTLYAISGNAVVKISLP